jgi:DNA-directed RNA polymerase sigma subunit (sigma70/sigma32)
MLKYLTDHARTIRLPQNKVVSINQMKHIESELTVDLQRAPTRDEIMDLYIKRVMEEKGNKTNPDDLLKAMVVDFGLTPLETPFNKSSDDMSTRPIDIISGSEYGSDHLATANNSFQMLLPFLSILSATDQEIILLRNGFKTNGDELSFGAIGEKLGYTSEHIRQHYNTSIRRLRGRIRSENMTIDAFL